MLHLELKQLAVIYPGILPLSTRKLHVGRLEEITGRKQILASFIKPGIWMGLQESQL